MLFVDYYAKWINLTKEPVVAKVTLKKYKNYLNFLQQNANDILLCELNRSKLQVIINEYGKTHHRTTTADFISGIYPCVLDAYEEGYIERLPTKKFINNGHTQKREAKKYLDKEELTSLINVLEFGDTISYDYFILLLAKTGLRYAEALALTREDIDLENRTLTVNKALDYGGREGKVGSFKKTKNSSSMRTIVLDWHFVNAFQNVLKGMKNKELVFGKLSSGEQYGKFFNSTANNFLGRACKKAEIPRISIHSLRHTHASILIAEGVSPLTISKRLGHASTEVTQKVYIHLTKELESKDTNSVVKALSGIF